MSRRNDTSPPGRPGRPDRWRAPVALLVAALAIPFVAACNMGPQPIPTPAVDPDKLVFELQSDERLCVSGDPGAVQPPGALVEVVNLRNVARAVVRARSDGSFGPVCLSGRLGDVVRVTALDDQPSSSGDSASVDVELRPGAGGGSGGVDAGDGALWDPDAGGRPGGSADAGGGTVSAVTAVPLVEPKLACLRVAPARIVLPVASNAPTAVVTAETDNTDDRTDRLTDGTTATDDRAGLEAAEASLTSAEPAPTIQIANECRFAVRLLKVAPRPPDGLTLRGAESGSIPSGTRREIAVSAAAPSSAELTSETAPTNADATLAADQGVWPEIWIVELHLAPEDAAQDADRVDASEVRRILVVSCDDPTAAADDAACAAPTPTNDVAGPGSTDVLVGIDADTSPRDTIRPLADANTGVVAARDTAPTAHADVPAREDAPPTPDTEDASSSVLTPPDATPPDATPPDATPPDATPVDACTGTSDREAIAALGDVHALALRCATERCADADRDCVIACLAADAAAIDGNASEPLLGRACATCFADEALCVRDTCADACTSLQPTEDARCKTCVDETCTPAFERCAGIRVNDIAAFSDAAAP